jgi:hypothetical protein
MRGRSTLIYFVLALGLLCYLTFIDKKIPGTREQEQSDAELFKFDQDDVTGLEISNVSGAIVLQKKGDHWEITSPVNTLADSAAVQEILGQIAYAQPQRTIHLDGSESANQNNLKEWGLAPAAERAVVHLKDKSLELLIGRKVAINDSVYARTSEHHNAPVRVIPNTVKLALEKNLSDLRSRNVFDFEADKVTRIATSVANTATTPAQECEVDLKDGKWTLQKPVVARAAAPDVTTVVDKILALRVTDFVTDEPGNLAQYGLTTPTTTLAVTVSPDDEAVLQIGSPVPGNDGQVYAQRLKSNAIYTLNQAPIADIVKALPNVRDKHVLPFDPGSATAVSFSLTGKNTVKADLRRDAGGWQVVGDSAGPADLGKITDLLLHLSQLQTTPMLKDSAPDAKPFGLDKPAGRIVVTTPGQKITLSLGKDENALEYVRNSIEPFIYTMPENSFAFLGDNLSYRDNRVITLVATSVKSITVTPQGKSPLILDRSPGGTWTAENAKDRQIDTTKAEAQSGILCELQAQRWLGPPQSGYGLDDPVLTFTIQAMQASPASPAAMKPVTVTLKIGFPLPDGTHAAQIVGAPEAFAMSEGDFGLLNSSTLELIPPELNATTNTPAATNAPPASAAAPSETPKKKKKKASN